jgi:hypothetical protein
MVRQAAPPTGQAPPAEALLRDGTLVPLAATAAAAAERHLTQHPEEIDHHGPHTAAWCRHDLQWVLSWAVQAADGQPIEFAAQLDWLARILAARDYPIASLADALDELAAAAEPSLPGAAALLRDEATRVRRGAERSRPGR